MTASTSEVLWHRTRIYNSDNDGDCYLFC